MAVFPVKNILHRALQQWVVNCLVPIYKEGNEPSQVKEYKSGKITFDGGIVISSKCQNVINEGNIERCGLILELSQMQAH